MSGKLIELSTEKLLEKFGVGNHKPGSGSASALEGMLAAKLLRTVIILTAEKAAYAEELPELLKIKQHIEDSIFPTLAALFQEDSDHFDKVIDLRRQRDEESEFGKRKLLGQDAQKALKTATELPIKIAALCLDLAIYACYVFDNGFRSARGDSAVALNGALAGAVGCLSIVELNLISLADEEGMDAILAEKANVKTRYNKLSKSPAERLAILEKESEESRLFHGSVAEFRKGNLANQRTTYADIEEIVRNLQNTVWLQREKIWKKETPEFFIQVLQTGPILKKVMQFNYVEESTLGSYSIGAERFEIAGLIDKKKKEVKISKRFPLETQRFTAAHELGHAILHEQTVMHRDRSIDGSAIASRNTQELQADKFAAFFLMPSKLVIEVFEEVFERKRFIINGATTLAMQRTNVVDFKRECKDLQGLARILSSAEYFGGKTFRSLAKIFGVSVTTMAIRLEELELIEF